MGDVSAGVSKAVNVDIIQCFAAATVSTFEQMCSLQLQTRKPYIKKVGSSVWGVSGVMGITGDVSGVVVLTLPEKTALGGVNAFVGESFTKVDASVIDGVKELTNIIVGTAKAKLSERGHEYNFSLPKVVIGHNYITNQGEDSNVIVIPFACKFGEFILDISIKPNRG